MKLTATMLTMLANVRDHQNPYAGIFGRAQHGSSIGTYRALLRRELVVDAGKPGAPPTLTREGRRILDKHRPAPPQPTPASATIAYNATFAFGVLTVIVPIPKGYRTIEKLLTHELGDDGHSVLRLKCHRENEDGY